MTIKVLHVITGLLTGGAEMMLYKLSQFADRERLAPAVVSLSDKGEMGSSIEALDVPVTALNTPRRGLSVTAYFRLRGLIKEIDPHVIQGWMYHGNLAATLAGRGRAVVWNIRHSLDDISKDSSWTRAAIRIGAMLSKTPEYIIYNSHNNADRHEAYGYCQDKRRVIANGFDTDLFAPSEQARQKIRQELHLPPDSLIIGLIARYHPIKDHANFLQAAALLHKRRPEARFVMAGAKVEPSNMELMQIIAQSSLQGAVFLLGNRKDMATLVPALDIVSSSSRGEAFPNVLGEAMSCGVPCVATDVGDSRYIIGSTGKVVPPGNPEALAAGWQEMVEMGHEGRRRLGGLAREHIIKNYSITGVASQYERIYQSLVGQNRCVG